MSEAGPSQHEGTQIRRGRIEGKEVSGFRETDLVRAIHIPLPVEIVWGQTRLTFSLADRYEIPEIFTLTRNIPVYTAQLEYEGEEGELQESNLSLTTSEDKPVYFTGTTNGFYAHDPLMQGRETPFYVVGLDVDQLTENQSKLSAVWHELGHVSIFHTEADIQLFQAALTSNPVDLPLIRQSDKYALNLGSALPVNSQFESSTGGVSRSDLFDLVSRYERIDKAVSLFHERNAWAAGRRIARANGYPTGFRLPHSFYEYARLCLSSYDRHFGGDQFVKGLNRN